MVYDSEKIIRFLKAKFFNQKVLVVCDECLNSENFVNKLSQFCIVITDEKFANKESVRAVVCFGKEIETSKQVFYFAKDIEDLLKHKNAKICTDFFCFDVKEFLCLCSQVLDDRFENFCNNLIENNNSCENGLLELLDVIKQGVIQNECNSTLEFLSHFAGLKEKFEDLCFNNIVKSILNFKLCSAFFEQKPYSKIFNKNSYSNVNCLYVKDAFIIENCNLLCYKLNETSNKLAQVAKLYGFVVKQIFIEFKKLCKDYGFEVIKNINSNLLICEFIKQNIKKQFSMVKIMFNLGLI